MAYSAINVEVHKIEHGKVYKSFVAREVTCDPCALPGSRYRLVNPYGIIETLAYWQLIVVPWDDARDRYIKWAMNREIARINDLSIDSSHAAWKANKFGTTPRLQLAGGGNGRRR
jgi:hypothetical protein